MKIIVFGATGRTGREILKQAATQGHSITAFVRNPDLLPSGIDLHRVQGDIFDAAQVAEAIRGHSAVLSALGARDLKERHLLGRAAPNIVAGMQSCSVSRLIVLGAAGVEPLSGKYQNGLTNLMAWLLKKTLLRHPFADHADQERILAASGLDYTIVRPPLLTDGPAKGTYRVIPDALPSGGRHISRADVAAFMLLQLRDPRFHRRGPYIAD